MRRDRKASALGLGHAQIADHNSRTILEALRRNGSMTRMELAALTGLSAPGITNVIGRHLSDGLVTEGQRKTPNAQVPSAEYSLRPEGAYAVGVRLRPDAVEAVLVDLGGTLCGYERILRAGANQEGVAALIRRLTWQQPAPTSFIGVGLVFEDRDRDQAEILRASLYEHRVVSELDTVAAVLAESTFGAGAPETGLVMVLLEDQVRSGLFLRSIPFAGAHGKAGRIGEMRTGLDRVALSDVCSTGSFARIARDAGNESTEIAVQRWVDRVAEHLLDALTAITSFIAPGKIVLDGDLPAPVIQAIIGAMAERWEHQRQESPPPPLPPVMPASFPQKSALLGAALLPFFETLLPKVSSLNSDRA